MRRRRIFARRASQIGEKARSPGSGLPLAGGGTARTLSRQPRGGAAAFVFSPDVGGKRVPGPRTAILVSLLTEVREAGTLEFASRKGFSDARLFEEFYRAQYDEAPQDELKALFLSVLGELEK